jgi:hypothetical protein
MDFLNHREGDVVFYQVFLLSLFQCTVTLWRNCKRLREFEEIEISRQGCFWRWLWIARRKTLKTCFPNYVQEFSLRVWGKGGRFHFRQNFGNFR